MKKSSITPTQSRFHEEATELLKFADQLGQLPAEHLDSTSKAVIADALGIHQSQHIVRYALAGGLVCLLIVSSVVQANKPGFKLNSIKQRGEDVRALVQPSFKTELEVRRQNEAATSSSSKNSGSGRVNGDSTEKSENKSGTDVTNQSGTLPTPKTEDSSTSPAKTETEKKSGNSGSGSSDSGGSNSNSGRGSGH